jgi:dihydrodipicolinate synthase/N-acetylneuraminate lyase
MQTTFTPADLQRSVISVPPLCRDASFKASAAENAKLIRHIENGGVDIFLYGGNANFYNIALSEYEEVLDQLSDVAGPKSLIIPAVGPYYATAVANPEGVRTAVLRFVEKFGRPAVLYVKDEGYVTVEVVKSLVEAGAISWIKYAVVRQDPANDPLLEAISNEVPRELLVSGIGEQPAIVHWTKFGVHAYTAGCVCVAPNRSQQMLEALKAGDIAKAETLREGFLKLEDLRNGYNPIQVLHHAVELAGIAATGPHLPLLADLDAAKQAEIKTAAQDLLAWSRE